MKKILLTFSYGLLILAIAKSQPTITISNQPVVGDQVISQATATVPGEGASGANQTWDFSSIIPAGPQTTSTYVTPASTPYAGTFPSANLASSDGSGNYAYYVSTGTDLSVNGVATSALQYPFTDNQKFFVYPCTYNTTFSDNTSANWVLNSVPTARTGSVSFTADGYGTLKLPSGTISNVLRVKYVEDLTDVITYGVTITINYHITIYSWYVPGNKNTLMSIAYDTTIFNGTPLMSSFASYYPLVVASPELQPTAQFLNAFPNPAATQSTISFTLEEPGDMTFSLINITGQVVKSWTEVSLSAGIHSEEIELGDLENGIYLVRLEMMNRKASTVRIVRN